MPNVIRIINNEPRAITLSINPDRREGKPIKANKVRLVPGTNEVSEEFWKIAIKNKIIASYIDKGIIRPLDLIRVAEPKPENTTGKKRGRPPKVKPETPENTAPTAQDAPAIDSEQGAASG
jgi:hypothetical protein